jgi:hypothetical protein
MHIEIGSLQAVALELMQVRGSVTGRAIREARPGTDPKSARTALHRLAARGFGRLGPEPELTLYPVGGAPTQAYAPTTISAAPACTELIEDAQWVEKPQPHFDSTSMVVYHGAAQPADNRRQLAIRRPLGTMTGAFTVRDSRQNGYALAPVFVSALNSAFVDGGESALNALTQAIDRNTHKLRAAKEQAIQLAAQRKAEEAKAEQERKLKENMDNAIRIMLNRGNSEDEEEIEDDGELRRRHIAEKSNRNFHTRLTEQMQQWPPDQYPGLYSHLAGQYPFLDKCLLLARKRTELAARGLGLGPRPKDEGDLKSWLTAIRKSMERFELEPDEINHGLRSFAKHSWAIRKRRWPIRERRTCHCGEGCSAFPGRRSCGEGFHLEFSRLKLKAWRRGSHPTQDPAHTLDPCPD